MSSAEEVAVGLSACSKEDADTVFGVLRTVYDCDRSAADVPQDAGGGRASVWTAVFDTADPHGRVHATPLASPVTANVQGGYRAVDSLRDTLAEAFAVTEEGTAAGDQEKDVHLRLEGRP